MLTALRGGFLLANIHRNRFDCLSISYIMFVVTYIQRRINVDLLADIEALQAELDAIPTTPTKEDVAALAKEESSAKEAAAKARGSRKKLPAVELDLATKEPVVEVAKPKAAKKPAKPKTELKTDVAAPAVKLEGLPKKVKEKALNAIKALETGTPASKYTKLAISKLREGGMKRGELVVFYAEAGLGKSTANAQASQMQALLPALGVAKNVDGVLEPVMDSPFISLGQ